MAIIFIVEDGTGLSDSTSYMSVADFKQFWENKGKDYTSTTDAVIQVALNNAADWMSYSFRYKGSITKDTQALDFPRAGICDRNGRDVSYEVPADIVKATAYLAQYEVIGKFLDVVQVTGVISKTMGPVATTFSSSIAAGSKQIKGACGFLADYVSNGKVKRGL